MAKEKSKSSAEETKETKSARKKAEPKKASAAGKSLQSAGGSPLVDTGLAAQNAAKLLVAGLKKPAAVGASAPQSKLFQQIKTGQSNASAIGGMLDKGAPQTGKPNQPLHGGNIKGHNQTFGSDASKAFVPRRTSGG